MTPIAWVLLTLLVLSVLFSFALIIAIARIFKAIKEMPEEQKAALYELFKKHSINVIVSK